MEQKFLKTIEELEKLSFFNNKTAYKFISNYLAEPRLYSQTFEEIANSLQNLSFCKYCNSIRNAEKCENCENSSKVLFIFENFNDAVVIISKNPVIEKLYIMNFVEKWNYLDNKKINLMLKNFDEFLNLNSNQTIEEIFIMISPSFQLEILKKLFIQSLKDKKSKIIIKGIPLGIPSDSDIKYYDKKIIQKVIEKSERFN